jgi:hypothetical protein
MLHIGAGVKTLSSTDIGVGHLMLHQTFQPLSPQNRDTSQFSHFT